MQPLIDDLLAGIRVRNPGETEFHQAVQEVLATLQPFLAANPHYTRQGLLQRMLEPERVLGFRVSWVDDRGEVQVNRGYRVQMNGAIGPYKGGTRFHPSVNIGILKFLAFEQTFKNALTTLPLGGGKGGADFDPKGRSDGEVMRFCQAYMSELYRHIGAETDIPAGDIGVGAREIGYLFGMYRKLRNEFTGSLTGKGPSFGGSLMRPQATGFGLVYFLQDMLATRSRDLQGLRVAVSGSGNVAQHAACKAVDSGALVVTLSDSDGTVYNPKGFSRDQLQDMMELKNIRRGRVSEMDDGKAVSWHAGVKPWQFPCDVALPCATQNELDEDDARVLVENGCFCVAEGANMPCTLAAITLFQSSKLLYAPGKACNAGGVAVSGLEMAQNALRQQWTQAEVLRQLKDVMSDIHSACVHHGTREDYVDYMAGANIAGFIKVADAMLAQGVI